MKSVARSSASLAALAFVTTTAPACRDVPFARAIRNSRDCVLADGPAHQAMSRQKVDLSALKLYRNTFAVSRVGPYENHFTVWFDDNEPEFLQVRATQDATGQMHIAADYGMWGGMSELPKNPKPPPADVAALQNVLAKEAQKRCPYVRDWVFEYEGAYREIDLKEMMSIHTIAGNERVGWHGDLTLAANESLTSVLPQSPRSESGDGLFWVYEPAQWVSFTPPANQMGSVLFIDRLFKMKLAPPAGSAEALLLDKTLEAARRIRDNATSPTLAEIVATQGPTLLPPGLDLHFGVSLDVYGRTKDISKQRHTNISIPMKTSEIVTGGARGETEQDVGNVHLKMRVALMPNAPIAPSAAGAARFAGSLALHVEDQNGHAFDRSYPANADLLVDGTTVVAPNGFQITDPSTPDSQLQFDGSFPERGEIESIDFYLGIGNDPRQP